jgi:hypothetical protein
VAVTFATSACHALEYYPAAQPPPTSCHTSGTYLVGLHHSYGTHATDAQAVNLAAEDWTVLIDSQLLHPSNGSEAGVSEYRLPPPG